MSGKLWQQPYVNVFKHFQVSEWKRCSKEGDVSTILDKTLKCTVYRISGSVPAGNYIQFPKTSSQSLGLTGHYLYITFKPIITKFFVVHVDVATEDGIIVRISFSNLFKEFKSTSTWLQFPFISTPVPGTVEDATMATLPVASKVGAAPISSRWTLFCMDLHYVLSVYLNRKYAYLKTIRLCASMMVKNVFTSDTNYQPGISMKVARKTGLLETGFTPLPREMSFPSEDLEDWKKRYDYVKFPAEDGNKSLRDVIPGRAKSPMRSRKSILGTISPTGIAGASQQNKEATGRKYSAKDYSGNPVKSRVALAEKLLAEHSSILPFKGTLPEIGVKHFEDETIDHDAVHIYARPGQRVDIHDNVRQFEGNPKEVFSEQETEQAPYPGRQQIAPSLNSLQPDPILVLDKVLGIGGGTMKTVLWTRSSSHIVYPCHAVIVSIDVKSGKQNFLLGHNKKEVRWNSPDHSDLFCHSLEFSFAQVFLINRWVDQSIRNFILQDEFEPQLSVTKISSLAFNGNSTLLASAQAEENAIIRIWKYKTKKCLAVFQSHLNDPYCLSFSQSGSKVCAVGSDDHGKRVLAVWDASFIMNGHKVTLIAKAHIDIHISAIKMCPFDDSKLVTCGKDNIRVWKIKRGSLRSHPVDLGDRPFPGFTDFDFESVQNLVQDPSNRKLFACTSSGSLFVVNFKALSVTNVYQLSPNNVGGHAGKSSNKPTNDALTCISLNNAFCAIGCNDGYVRLWPLDFDGPFMEAEHEGPIAAVAVSLDGILVAAVTETGNLGVLDISKKSYKTLIRSHLKRITSFSFDNIRNHIATVSEDKGIKIWERPNMNQLYDFRSPGENPCIVAFHPSKELLVCGFDTGCIRIFDVASTRLVAEQKNHGGKIVGLVITPDGNYMHACDTKGSLALYDALTDDFGLIRLLPNALAKLEEYSANAIVIDSNGHRLACIGPSEFVITVFDARSLDELLRIDITSMANSVNRSVIDAAHLLCYTPKTIGHLVAVSSSSRMLKLEANTGQLLSEVSNIHRGKVTGIAVSPNGKYLATSGDKVIKIWDYYMRMDLNFQVFIGHSDPIMDLKFTRDGSQVYSIGECIFVWGFLGKRATMEAKRNKYQSPKKMLDFSLVKKEQEPPNEALPNDFNSMLAKDSLAYPRGKAPQPREYEPLNLSVSPIPQEKPNKRMDETLNISSEGSSEHSFSDLDAKPMVMTTPDVKRREQPILNHMSPVPVATMETVTSHHAPPNVMAHFKARTKISRLAEKRYSAPPNQAGLKLKAVIGYDGLGRNNMIWHSLTGLFAYVCGCMVVIEDLTTGKQRHLRYHTEDISTLAAQHDGQVIASAAIAAPATNKTQICIWEVSTGLCRKFINHHKYVVIAMQYSRDDRLLVTVGDYRECSVAIWSTMDYTLLVTSFTRYPIHAVKWDPYTMNEFATVGQNGSVLFWLLDETKQQAVLNIHEAEVPEEVFNEGQDSTFDLTSLAYAGDSVLYVGASNGVVSAWDTRQNTCFMHWKSDNAEILQIVAVNGKMITGGASTNLCLWSVAGVVGLREQDEQNGGIRGRNTLVMDDEMQLDGCIVSAVFDSNLDIGVVGTNAGTLWYISWEERTSIRLVSGHKDQVNSLVFAGLVDDYMATCASDGSMRLWNTESYEQTLQFLVLNQSCSCVAFRPVPQPSPLHALTQDGRHETTIHPKTARSTRPSQCVAGYSDGTVRMFDLGLAEMVLKMQPHPVKVTAISFSSDGRVIISGAEDGSLAINSPATGMTVRMLNDHRGAPITDLHVSMHKDHSYSLSSPFLWLAASGDRRVSIWSADWSKDFCELVDWLSFPAPNFAPDGTIIKKSDKDYYHHFPPSLARFSPIDADIVVYTGYGMKKQISYYSLSQKKVVKAVSLTEWVLTMDISSKENLIAVGSKDRLVKIVDYKEGTFQDFVGHSDAVQVIKFSPTAKLLFSIGYTDVIVWEVDV